MDKMADGRPSIIGAVTGMIAGFGRYHSCCRSRQWLGRHYHRYRCRDYSVGLDEQAPEGRLYDAGRQYAERILHVWGASLCGGLLGGILAKLDMVVCVGTGKEAPGVSITGFLYGDTGTQLLPQLLDAAFIIVHNGSGRIAVTPGGGKARVAARACSRSVSKGMSGRQRGSRLRLRGR